MQGTQGWRKDERGTGGSKPRFSNRDRAPIEPTTSRRLARDLEPTHPLRTNFSKGAPAPKPIKLDPSFPPNLQPTPSAFIAKSQPKESIPSLPFSDYSLNPALKEGLAKFFAPSNPDHLTGQPQPQSPLPTPIQHLSLQHFLGSKNRPLNKKPGRKEVHQVLLGSDTGSGKTLAYLLPLLDALKRTDKGIVPVPPTIDDPTIPRSIVLSPSHELTRQLTRTFKAFSHGIKLSVQGMSSTANGTLKPGVTDVLVGTVRNLERLVDKGVIDLGKVEWVVVDEADVLLGPDFEGETNKILDRVGIPSPSLILTTATIPPSLIAHLKTHLPDCQKLLSPTLHRLPIKLETRFVPWSGSGNKLADVVHELRRTFAADAMERRHLNQTTNVNPNVNVNEDKSKILVFANSPRKVKALERMLENKDVPVLAITGEADDRARGTNGRLDDFLLQPGGRPAPPRRAGSAAASDKAARVLITTSLLSRGLDFAPSVKHVFLLDEPRDILDFMHRAGRTGRAGRVGQVTVFGSSGGGGGKGMFGRHGEEARRKGMKQWQRGTKLGQELKQVMARD
ncbi:hypothetical protein FFLO_02649 [Filobasidium floriforme]|uniref:RNA helicase n=1 Tax=Filobasidium floriforme TaxID=5210 RepID=A0A8K0NRM1_9TREE|nr:putative RNA helicase [Filobasidium floriforme]KAG7561920.1 hypothetical protein FFLO_02649 [Filobasidium floriforme]KAH8089401.1 putative RNA helicase [Filobasidium floriforme]